MKQWESEVLIVMNSIPIRLRVVLGVLAFGLISGMALSWSLWMGDRVFPYFPVFDFLPQIPGVLDEVVLLGFWVMLGVAVWKPNRFLVLGIVCVIAVYALQDQMRWQPWFYQYLLMLLPFIFIRWSENENKGVMGLLQMIVVMIYLWGGIHKCHMGFINVWNESMVKPLLDVAQNETWIAVLKGAGYTVPGIEILIGVGLLFKRTRLVAIIVALGTHIVILILLGPVKGHISNSVVWPWNLVMMVLVVVLFYKVERVELFAFWKIKLKFVGCCLWGLMVLAPVLFYFNMWDRYLSFNLYSGQQKRLVVFVKESVVPELPEEWSDYYSDSSNKGYTVLNVAKWSREEMNIPMLTEWRILRSFSKYVAMHDNGQAGFVYYVDHPRLHDLKPQTFTKNKLNEMGSGE